MIGQNAPEAGQKLMADVAALLRQRMKEQGVKGIELAARTGRSKAQISQMLKGDANLTLRSVSDLFFALGRRPVFQAVKPADEQPVEIVMEAEFEWPSDIWGSQVRPRASDFNGFAA